MQKFTITDAEFNPDSIRGWALRNNTLYGYIILHMLGYDVDECLKFKVVDVTNSNSNQVSFVYTLNGIRHPFTITSAIYDILFDISKCGQMDFEIRGIKTHDDDIKEIIS